MSDEGMDADGGESAPSNDGGGSAYTGDGGSGTVSGGGYDEGGGSDGAEAQGGEGGAPEPKAPAGTEAEPEVQRWKVGDEDLSADEMHARLSPDWEMSVQVDGKDHAVRRADFPRYLSQGVAGLKRMQQGTEMRQKYEDALAAVGQDPRQALDDHLDSEKYPNGHLDWARELAMGEFTRQKQLQELQATNPIEYQREVARAAQEKAERSVALEKARTDRQAKTEAAQRSRTEFNASVPKALEAAGLPMTPGTHAHLSRVYGQHQQVGYDIPLEHAAAEAAQGYTQEVSGFLGSTMEKGGPEALLKVLGPEMRQALVKYEADLARGGKGGKKAAPQQQQAPSAPRRPANGRADKRGPSLNEALADFTGGLPSV